MEIVYERVAGIDVHNKQITVAVRVPGEQPGRAVSRCVSTARSTRRCGR